SGRYPQAPQETPAPGWTVADSATAPATLITGTLSVIGMVTSSVASGTPAVQLPARFQSVLTSPVQVVCAMSAPDASPMTTMNNQARRKLVVKTKRYASDIRRMWCIKEWCDA